MIGTGVTLDVFAPGTSERRQPGPAHQALCGHTLALHVRPWEVPRSWDLEHSLSGTYFLLKNSPHHSLPTVFWILCLYMLPNWYYMEHIGEMGRSVHL